MCDVNMCETLICVTHVWVHISASRYQRLVNMCDTTRRYLWLLYMRRSHHMNESRHTYKRVTPHIVCVTRLVDAYDMAHSYVSWIIHMCVQVWHDSLIPMTWIIHMCHESYMNHTYVCICVTSLFDIYVWHDSFMCVTWLIHMCDTTRSYVWHHSLTPVTRLAHMCDMTHSCVWHDSFICVTWLIHMCDMTHSYVWCD